MSALKLTITSWGEVALDKKGLKALMRGAANDVKSKTARLISVKAGGGRVYRGHHASAPGDPPVMLTGALKSSLKSYVYPDGDGFAVRERAFYSLFLESGATGGGNFGAKGSRAARRRRAIPNSRRVLLPRPHLDRVMTQEQARLDQRVRKAFEQGLTWRQTR